MSASSSSPFKPIKFGTIGTSSITELFINSAHATSQWSLTAIQSRSHATASAFAAKFSIGTFYTSIDEICRDDDIEAIYIASPNSCHLEHAKMVLAAGKHAIVEKPIVSNVDEFEHLVAFAHAESTRAEKTGGKRGMLIEAYRHLQESNFKVLKECMLEKLGSISGANLMFASYSSRFTSVLEGTTLPIVFDPAFSGGCLVDMGVYPISFAISLFGRPLRQRYHALMIDTVGSDIGGPVILEYDGFTVTIQTSKGYSSTAPSEIYGAKGTLKVDGVTDISSITFIDAKTKSVEELGGSKERLNLIEEAREFARLIREEDVDGVKALERLSRDVVTVTEDLRRQNGIRYPVDKW